MVWYHHKQYNLMIIIILLSCFLKTHLSDGLQSTCGLQLVDSVALGLAVRTTLWHLTFATSTSNSNAVDNVTYKLLALALPTKLNRGIGVLVP